MSGYVIARENFKEAERQVSAERDPVMFNLLYGLQSLTEQIEIDFASLHQALAARAAAAKPGRSKPASKKNAKARKPAKKAARRSR